jgi:cytochrome c oxidase subunit 3
MTLPSALALRFQFETEEQQKAAAYAGMWFFLATEVVMFGALFTSWSVYRTLYENAFAVGSNLMDVRLGTLNTAVLLTSSLAMALAVRSAAIGRQHLIVLFLIVTMTLGAVFLGIKFYEYWEHYHAGEMPGFNWTHQGPETGHVEIFYLFYYIMTGLHAVHMLIGMGLLGVLTARAALGRFTAEYHTPVEIVGLYWHFVDIVWVFLFPLFYLTGRHLH